MTTSNTDRIEKSLTLRAPLSRVWRALTDSGEFGTWFRVALDGPFAVGERVTGHITYPGYEHLKMEADIVAMDASHYFAFRWHPAATDPAVDYTAEPTTLVEFRLDAVDEGTHLTVSESGFDQLPEGRRAHAFRMNEGGWATQLENIRAHVAG